MTKVSDLTHLFHAIAARDWQRIRECAEALVEAEKRAGHHGSARILRGALSSAMATYSDAGLHHDENRSQRFAVLNQDLLTPLPPASTLEDVELQKATRKTLKEVVLEFKQRQVLAAHNLQPRSRLLFHGPPGCGKTLTARALGKELSIPVFVLRLDALVGSLLGQTALRIHEVFRFAETQPCIVLIDEIDAIGRHRGRPTDVGELDRVVISLMQQLDLVQPMGLLIAASNVPKELDAALLRRFDLAIHLPKPNVRQLLCFAQTQARTRGIIMNAMLRRALGRAKTYSDVVQLVTAEHRRQVLREIEHA